MNADPPCNRPSFMAMLVVGSPERGLVGIGRGRGNTTIRAMDAGFHKGQYSLLSAQHIVVYILLFSNRG